MRPQQPQLTLGSTSNFRLTVTSLITFLILKSPFPSKGPMQCVFYVNHKPKLCNNFLLIVRLSPEFLLASGPTELCCASTLVAALLTSSRVGSDLGLVSRLVWGLCQLGSSSQVRTRCGPWRDNSLSLIPNSLCEGFIVVGFCWVGYSLWTVFKELLLYFSLHRKAPIQAITSTYKARPRQQVHYGTMPQEWIDLGTFEFVSTWIWHTF